MAALGVVRARSAPVLREKQRQPMACSGQVGLRVDRPEAVVGGNALVETVDQGLEEGMPPAAWYSDVSSVTGRV